MNTVTLHFKADNQQLTALDGLYKLASNTVEYVKAIFTLGENWAGFDVVRAAWYTDFECISTVLDGNGECFVPWEVLSRPEGVTINLYGCDLEEESDGEAVLVDRLTTYPVKAILVDVDARVCGSETKPVTPSQFEQYIAIVQELVGTVRDITSCVLNPDYTLTINYSDDTSDTVGPIRGEQGEQGPTGPAGNGISKIEKISTAGLVDTYRITFTNGTHKDYTVTNGAKGDTGNGIESIYLTGTSGAVKTYTILFTNGNTFEYQVTDGEVTRAELEAVLPTDTASGSIASFPDGSDLFDYLSCVVNIDPVQDLHGYDKPWVGGAGKNIANDNASDYTRPNDYWIVPLRLEQGQTYTVSASFIGSAQLGFTVAYVKSGDRYANFDGFNSFITSSGSVYTRTFTVDATYTEPKLAIYITNPQTTDHLAEFFSTVAHIQVEKGSSATSYEPYANICPITGWTGCEVTRTAYNMFNGEYNVMYKLPAPIPHGTWVTASAKTNDNTQIYYYDVDGAYIDYYTLNQTDPNDSSRRYRTFKASQYVNKDVYYIRFQNATATDMQFELSSENALPSAYESPTTYPITWQTEAGTVYGGKLHIAIVNNEPKTWIVVTDGYADLASLSFIRTSSATADSSTCYYATVSGMKTDVANTGMLSDSYSLANGIYISTMTDGTMIRGNGYVYIATTQNISGHLKYPLATPQTYQLTPTQIHALLGQNNVWADCGDTSVTYKADVQRWVEKKLGA